MVPYADMLNHKHPGEAQWYYSDKRKGFIIEAIQNIPFGAPIHESYGSMAQGRSTAELFFNYGFVIHPSDDD